jgi:hypothetical protein
VSTTWYHARWGKVEPVQVEKETEQSIWIGGSRRAKKSGGGFYSIDHYYPTWAEAREALLKEAQEKVNSLRRQLDLANGALGNIKGKRSPPHDPAHPRRRIGCEVARGRGAS